MNSKFSAKTEKSDAVIFLLGVVLALGVTVGAMAVSAAVMTFAHLGKSWSLVLSSVSAGTGGFFGGIYSSKRSEKRGIVAGFIVGALLSAVILVISLAVHGENFTKLSLIRLVIILLSACIGGIFGKSNKEKRLVK